MTREEVFDRLNIIFRNIFDDENIILNDETTAADIEGWDSFEQINIIFSIQNEFNITFNIKEVNSLKNVGEIVDDIMEKIK